MVAQRRRPARAHGAAPGLAPAGEARSPHPVGRDARRERRPGAGIVARHDPCRRRRRRLAIRGRTTLLAAAAFSPPRRLGGMRKRSGRSWPPFVRRGHGVGSPATVTPPRPGGGGAPTTAPGARGEGDGGGDGDGGQMPSRRRLHRDPGIFAANRAPAAPSPGSARTDQGRQPRGTAPSPTTGPWDPDDPSPRPRRSTPSYNGPTAKRPRLGFGAVHGSVVPDRWAAHGSAALTLRHPPLGRNAAAPARAVNRLSPFSGRGPP